MDVRVGVLGRVVVGAAAGARVAADARVAVGVVADVELVVVEVVAPEADDDVSSLGRKKVKATARTAIAATRPRARRLFRFLASGAVGGGGVFGPS
ncbi:hypothetical protein [Rhodococcus sp. IEGM 1307]|uniref:hypothetical protein n=1 Tax=Rhodococcus sp. IEGM 1307 TaxID=3047091 RepID=UPI0024B7A09A|nr:hypothetical protein [Rhodococcus sp. IEGM 1307]MDI9973366.1 hypothetical protein [Rhodococcus sp. IEGM 1307]